MARPVKLARAVRVLSAPSRSRTLERIFLAIRNATSSGMLAPRSRALDSTIWARVSKSGGSIGTDRPDARRDFSRGYWPSTSRGKRSKFLFISCLPSTNTFNVRKDYVLDNVGQVRFNTWGLPTL